MRFISNLMPVPRLLSALLRPPIVVLSLFCGLTHLAGAQAPKPATAEQVVTFKIVERLGNRPVIKARVNGFPVRLVLHANAGFSMQLSHEMARRGQLTNLVHVGSYGIEAVGKVSQLGRDSAFVEQFAIGQVRYAHVPVSVFETPSDVGMLGLRWLLTNRVVMDYRKNQVVLNPLPATVQRTREQLLRAGYVVIPLRRDPADGRYLTPVTIDSITRAMVVSTIGEVGFDSEFARQAHLPQKDTGGSYGGPTGTTGHVYALTNPVVVRLGTLAYSIPAATIEDTYAYAATKRPPNQTLARGGMLGGDFLAAHQAVFDFGNAVLYLKK